MPQTPRPHAKVSVLMPAHNTGPFIGAALESVLSQTYSNVEVIVVNDRSTDGTADVALQYARSDPRVKVRSGEFGSAAAARNEAIAQSTGEWFALLDSDDVWAPLFLERQFDALAQYPGAMLVSGNAINLGGRWDHRPLDSRRHVRTLEFSDLLRDETAVCITTVFNRQVVDAVGRFDATLNRNEDYDLWLRATHAGFRIVKNPEPLAYYRRRSDSLSYDEAAMLSGILRVLMKVQRWELMAGDRALLNRQIARFERRRLVVEARRALTSREFTNAAELFRTAARKQGGWKATVAAVATHYWPEWVFRLVEFRDRRFAKLPRLLDWTPRSYDAQSARVK